MQLHLSFKVWAIAEDLDDSHPLNTSHQKIRLRMNASLETDDLSDGPISKQIILPRLAGIHNVINIRIRLAVIDQMSPILGQTRRGQWHAADRDRAEVTLIAVE